MQLIKRDARYVLVEGDSRLSARKAFGYASGLAVDISKRLWIQGFDDGSIGKTDFTAVLSEQLVS